VLVLLATALTGCRRNDDAPVDEPVQLSVFWFGGTQRAEATEAALRLYSQRNPRVTFRVTWQNDAGYYQRLATQTAAGNAPDLFQIDDDFLTEYAERDITLDLTDFVERGRLDLSGLSPSLVAYGRVDGRTVAVAAAENTPGLIYNRSLLRRIGVDDPRTGMTYQQYLDWAAEVTDRSGGRVAGSMDASADYRALWLWLRAQGKELYQGRQLGCTAGDVTRWFQLWQRARGQRATPSAAVVQPANSGIPARQLVVTGRAAASFAWSNQLSEFQGLTRDELGVMAYPGNPRAQWPRASMYWAGYRGTRHAAAVADVINFLTNDPQAGRILGTERGLSANLVVRQAVAQAIPDAASRRMAVFESTMRDVFGPSPAPPPTGHATVRARLVAAAEQVQYDRLTAAEAAEQFVKQANAALGGG
jgi:multiple sugar transport system substrate-binding protein